MTMCNHPVADVEYVHVKGKGDLMLEICEECHEVVAYCEHSKNSWDDEGTVLSCDLCGLDVT
jgi:hypothetical protein